MTKNFKYKFTATIQLILVINVLAQVNNVLCQHKNNINWWHIHKNFKTNHTPHVVRIGNIHDSTWHNGIYMCEQQHFKWLLKHFQTPIFVLHVCPLCNAHQKPNLYPEIYILSSLFPLRFLIPFNTQAQTHMHTHTSFKSIDTLQMSIFPKDITQMSNNFIT